MDRVKYTFGRTLNMGSYESLRFDIGVEVDCEPEKLEETLEESRGLVMELARIEEKRWRNKQKQRFDQE